MLLPKRTKFRRQHRGRLKGVSNANTVVFGEYGIQTLLVPFYSINNPAVISYEQLFNSAKGGVVPFSTIISYSNDIIPNVERRNI
jgi:large subunit ribosomal protein L16